MLPSPIVTITVSFSQVLVVVLGKIRRAVLDGADKIPKRGIEGKDVTIAREG